MREYKKPKTLAEAEEQADYFQSLAGNLYRKLERCPIECYDETFSQWKQARTAARQALSDRIRLL